jgi:hypothetical protein
MKSILLAVLLALTAPAQAAVEFYDSTVEEYIVWHVGDPDPLIEDYSYGDTMWCYAQGPELAFIQAHFNGLRMMTGSHVTDVEWLNEDCEFLYNNL